MNSRISDLIDDTPDEIELDGTLKHLEDRTVDRGSRLHKSLYVLQRREGDVCLKCTLSDAEIFFRWNAGDLEELEIRSDGTPSARPQTAGPVRTEAVLETAEGVELVDVGATPFSAV